MDRRHMSKFAAGLIVAASLLVTACGARGIDLSIAPADAAESNAEITPSVLTSPLSGPAGTIVEVVASGFPAFAHVSVDAGQGNSEFVQVAAGTADADGFFIAEVKAQGAPGMALVFAVSAEGQPGVLCPDRFRITEKAGAWTAFSNSVYAVSLQRPSHWQRLPEYSDPELGDRGFGAADGFLLVSAVEYPGLIDDVAAGEANHRQMPYGSEPAIESLMIAGQEARLIRPSADQYPSMNGQAALIVRYPQPVSILGHLHNFFVLYVAVGHVEALAQMLVFAGQ